MKEGIHPKFEETNSKMRLWRDIYNLFDKEKYSVEICQSAILSTQESRSWLIPAAG